ncbi:class I SAM-dependent methyltransferase [Labrys okinawensis]|uniref:class I SAM-dependent methyltransferase n=1 Tax=Labrys okinawensis TaxID=346911 RepID=UPI0039BCE710
MDVEGAVARHYTHGSLEKTLFAALQSRGKDPDNLAIEDLADIDEFHLGWGSATEELAEDLGFEHGMTILEVGSGIGGPARHLARLLGCDVVGVDLTPEFVEVAQTLTKRCHLSGKVSFVQGSALAMPFADGEFDGAAMLHVGMNIADKAALFQEVRRVLRHGARFGVYDIMRVAEGELPYPMPWAMTMDTSFVEGPSHYRKSLEDAGFAIDLERSHRDLALKLGREMRDKAAQGGAAPAGPLVLMGESAPMRIGNVMSAVADGSIAPIEMIARAV